MTEKLKFDTNIAVAMCLKFDEGKDVEGIYGDQVMYTVKTEHGERVMYVPPHVRSLRERANIAAGDWFQIGKFEVKSGNRKTVQWKVELIPPDADIPGVEDGDHPPAIPAPVLAPASRSNAPSNGDVQSTFTTPQNTAQCPVLVPPSPQPAAAAAHAPEPPRSKTKLEDMLRTVVAAVHAAQQYAQSIGFQMPPPTFEDLRTMTNTMMIEARNGNGGAR